APTRSHQSRRAGLGFFKPSAIRGLTPEFTRSPDQSIFRASGAGYDVACGTGFVQTNEHRGTWGGTGDDAEVRVFGTVRAGDRRGLAARIHRAGRYRRGGCGPRRVLGCSRGEPKSQARRSRALEKGAPRSDTGASL